MRSRKPVLDAAGCAADRAAMRGRNAGDPARTRGSFSPAPCLLRSPRCTHPSEYAQLTAGHTLHELGPISNICADWGQALSQGPAGPQAGGPGQHWNAGRVIRRRSNSSTCAIETIDAVLALAARYAQAARALGRQDVAETLERVPAHSAAHLPRGAAIAAPDARRGLAERPLSRRPGAL